MSKWCSAMGEQGGVMEETGEPVTGDDKVPDQEPQDITCRGGLTLPPMGASCG